MNNEFRKDRLNNGCIVQIRDGSKFIFLKNANNEYRVEDVFIDIEDFTWLALNEYSSNLTHLKDNSYDIVKICDFFYKTVITIKKTIQIKSLHYLKHYYQ